MSLLVGTKKALLAPRPPVVTPPPAGFLATRAGFQEDETDLTTYTFAAFSIGAASAGRVCVVQIWSNAGTANSIDSVTIGGVTATAAVKRAAVQTRQLAIYYAVVPTGTTADVVVTFSGVCTRAAAELWAITGTTQTAPSAVSGSEPNTNASTTTLAAGAVTIPVGGLGLASAWIGSTSGGPVTWTQTTGAPDEEVDELVGASALWASSCHSNVAGSQAFTVTGPTTAQFLVAAISWGP